MHKLMVIFHQSSQMTELERQWGENFVAQAERMPGLRRVAVSRVGARLIEQTQIHLIHEFFFEDESALRQALASPEGQAAGEALMRFAARDITLVMAEHLEEARGADSPRSGPVGSTADEGGEDG
ncbi:MAG: EthD family reductase [Anaerolineales bacterium]|jgi:uncharacterized protein (TIGR02118 family)